MRSRLRKLVVSAMMAALSILLMTPFFEIPFGFLFPIAPWLKLDFSTTPVLFAGFACGPLWGVAVQLVKSIIHIPMGTTGGIGELADFIMGTAMVLPASLIYMRLHTRKGALIGMATGTVMMVIAGALSNYYILLPMYAGRGVTVDIGAYITTAAIPFNLVKGIAVSLLTFLLYKYISPLLRGTWKKDRNERKATRSDNA